MWLLQLGKAVEENPEIQLEGLHIPFRDGKKRSVVSYFD